MKKLISVLLFVAIVSNNLFGQDTTIVTYGAQICKINSQDEFYDKSTIKPVLNEISFSKECVKFDKLGGYIHDTLYNVYDYSLNADTEMGVLADFYYCKDSKGINCKVIIFKKGILHNDARVEVQYANASILYFLRD